MRIHSSQELSALKEKIQKKKSQMQKLTQIIVYGSTCGIASGAGEVWEAINGELARMERDDVVLLKHACMGCCYAEPYISIKQKDSAPVFYASLNEDKATEVVRGHLLKNEIANEYLLDLDTPFFTKQTKRITELLGKIDPFEIGDYIANDGYLALASALRRDRKEVIAEVTASGLRGRGGAGFPTGKKWEFAYGAEGKPKYIVCNADEGDPGAYMNRAELEGNPQAVLEGMAIAGYAIGANKGYLYVRAEYPLAVETLKVALDQAREHGFLGTNILGTSFDFDIELFLGSGAFVCGEETALLASLEQKRGNPRHRPPFPAIEGLFGKPTVINNVGTLSNIPLIIRKGAKWWDSIGTDTTKGAKVFCLTGKINRGGLIEVPMGMSLNEIVFDIGGGIPAGKAFKAAQLGGPSGGCIPRPHLDLPIDYGSLQEIGCIMGSGGMVILDEDSCMVDTARFFLEFDRDESCGQCLPCRRGLPLMIETLEKISAGKGKVEDLCALEELADGIKK
ncbi:MAG: NADH dehydrogenase, partial [Desulfuromonadales bacterium C00003068]